MTARLRLATAWNCLAEIRVLLEAGLDAHALLKKIRFTDLYEY